MKNLTIFLLALILVVVAGCDSTSVQGPEGPQGEPGNANVRIYKFGGHDFQADYQKTLLINEITSDTMENSAWFVYLSRYGTSTQTDFMIPGRTSGGSYYYSWNIYSSSVERMTMFIIRDSGPGEAYDTIKVVRIYANTTSGRPEENLPAIDFSNFETVREYYGIKED